jgi:hypothetical protein
MQVSTLAELQVIDEELYVGIDCGSIFKDKLGKIPIPMLPDGASEPHAVSNIENPRIYLICICTYININQCS